MHHNCKHYDRHYGNLFWPISIFAQSNKLQTEPLQIEHIITTHLTHNCQTQSKLIAQKFEMWEHCISRSFYIKIAFVSEQMDTKESFCKRNCK